MLPELKKQIETERSIACWSGAVRLNRPLTNWQHSQQYCMLFYNGVENIFKRIAVALDGGSPQGEFWHSELIEKTASPAKKRPALLSEAMNEQLQEYLDFRHVFRHAYTLDLKWSKMKHLAVECEAVLRKFEKEL